LSAEAPAAPPTVEPAGLNRRLAAVYLFCVYVMAAASETFISPFFPIVRHDLGLDLSNQATLIAVLTTGIGLGNLLGGAVGYRLGDRLVVRAAALSMSVGALVCATAPSFWQLVVGQAISGLGIGVFFAPGLASVGRMFPATRGRALATYGLGYSVGTAVAAFAAGINGIDWRLPFFVTAILTLGLAIFAPTLLDATGGRPPAMLASLRGYLRSPFYRMSLVTALVAGAATYIVIGFSPTLFVDRGISLTVVGFLIGVGRLASVGGKFVSGWAYDRFGGPRSAQWLMLSIALCGVPLVALPGGWGVVAIVPFVLVTACLFPISNALSVAGLPERSTWGVGVYRALLVGSSALLAGIVGLLLDHVSLDAVMYGSLLLPVAGWFVAGVMTRKELSTASMAGAH
jgi:predicted MFS family arabinose efflux permease